MIRWLRAKKVVDNEIVGFWSKRDDEDEEEFATLEQIYEFAVKTHDDIKNKTLGKTERLQYGVMQHDGIMLISISKKDDQYLINNMRGENLQNVLDKLPLRND